MQWDPHHTKIVEDVFDEFLADGKVRCKCEYCQDMCVTDLHDIAQPGTSQTPVTYCSKQAPRRCYR